MNKKLIFTAIFSILLILGVASAEISTQIPIQGRLLDANNIPISGQRSLTFRIFETSAGGNQLFAETINNVPVTNGLFSTVLGEDTNNPLTLSFDRDYYIEISVNGEPLSPRQRLLASPYAISSKNVFGGVVRAVDGQFADKVGIGTTNPAARLDLKHNSTNTYSALIENTLNASGTFGLGVHIKNAEANSWPLVIYSGNSNKFVVRGDGNVGIGTANPQAKLHVEGSGTSALFKTDAQTNVIIDSASNDYGQILFRSNGTNKWQLQKDASGNFRITKSSTNTPELFINDSTGHVGIGMSNPSTKLEVAGHVTATGLCLANDCRQSWPSSGSSPWIQDGNNIYYTNGNVGIGSITPDNNLVVKSRDSATIALDATNETQFSEFKTRGGGSDKWSIGSLGDLNTRGVGPNGFYIYQYTDQYDNNINKYRFVINDNGNVGIGTTNLQSRLTINVPYNNGDNLNSIGFTHNNGQPVARIATAHTNSGTYMSLGTSNNYATGITNAGITINPEGNVGVGTANPTEKLDVNGSIQTIGTGGNGGRIALKSTAQGGHQYEIYSDSPSIGDLGFFDRTTGAQPLTLTSSGSVKVNNLCIGSDCRTAWPSGGSSQWSQNGNNIYYNNNGSVGIGTTTPYSKLHVYNSQGISSVLGTNKGSLTLAAPFGTSGVIQSIDFEHYNGSTVSRIASKHQNDGTYLVLGTSNDYASGVTNEALTINPHGKIGIGTTTPDRNLVVAGSNSAGIALDSTNETLYAEYITRSGGTNKWSIGSLADKIGGGVEPNSFYIYQYSYKNDSPASLYRLVIDNYGRTGIGVKSPEAKLHISLNQTSDYANAWDAFRIVSTDNKANIFAVTQGGLTGDYSGAVFIGNYEYNQQSYPIVLTGRGTSVFKNPVQFISGVKFADNTTQTTAVPKSIRGSVTSSGTVSSGTGFTITKRGVGIYDVEFSAPFSTTPSATVTPIVSEGQIPRIANVERIFTTYIRVRTYELLLTGTIPYNAIDSPFGFVVSE